MNQPNRTKYAAVNIPTGDVESVRRWIRNLILNEESDMPEAARNMLFKMWEDLGKP